MVLSIVGIQDASGSKQWTGTNFNGTPYTIYINAEIQAIEVRYQNGYGIVNIRFQTVDDIWTNWATTNQNGNIQTITSSTGRYRGIQGRYQSGYGIVDLRALEV